MKVNKLWAVLALTGIVAFSCQESKTEETEVEKTELSDTVTVPPQGYNPSNSAIPIPPRDTTAGDSINP